MVVLVGFYGYSFQTKHFGGTSGNGRIFLCNKGMHPKSKLNIGPTWLTNHQTCYEVAMILKFEYLKH